MTKSTFYNPLQAALWLHQPSSAGFRSNYVAYIPMHSGYVDAFIQNLAEYGINFVGKTGQVVSAKDYTPTVINQDNYPIAAIHIASSSEEKLTTSILQQNGIIVKRCYGTVS